MHGYLLGLIPSSASDRRSAANRYARQWLGVCDSREEALFRAHTEGALTMSAIAKELGVSVSRVSRLIARAEEAKGKT